MIEPKHIKSEKKEKKKATPVQSILLVVGLLLIIGSLFVLLQATSLNPEPKPIEIDHTHIPSPTIVIDTRPFIHYNFSNIGGSLSIPYECYNCYKEQLTELDLAKTYTLYGPQSKNASKVMFAEGFTNLYILIDYDYWVKPYN